MSENELQGEALQIFRTSTPEVQRQFLQLQTDKVHARELADVIGNAVVENFLPIKVIKLTADYLLEDYKQIVAAAEDMAEEARVVNELRTGEKIL